MQNDDSSLARVLIPIGLLLTCWLTMLFLARRNERKVRSEWVGILRGSGGTFEHHLPPLLPSWVIFARRHVSSPTREIPAWPIIRLVYAVVFDYLPNRCWACRKLMLEKHTRYRKDDVQHFLEEAELPSPPEIEGKAGVTSHYSWNQFGEQSFITVFATARNDQSGRPKHTQ